MRSIQDRIRHALLFEILGLVVVTPLGAWLFHFPLHDIGIVALVSATIAAGWNLVYNYLFDQLAQRLFRTTLKGGLTRIVHAICFELGLLVVLMPFIAWYLGVSIWQALVMDLSFAVFYMGYAFVFNWAYDRVFPLAEWNAEP